MIMNVWQSNFNLSEMIMLSYDNQVIFARNTVNVFSAISMLSADKQQMSLNKARSDLSLALVADKFHADIGLALWCLYDCSESVTDIAGAIHDSEIQNMTTAAEDFELDMLDEVERANIYRYGSDRQQHSLSVVQLGLAA
jgi:hypothetical protein